MGITRRFALATFLYRLPLCSTFSHFEPDCMQVLARVKKIRTVS